MYYGSTILGIEFCYVFSRVGFLQISVRLRKHAKLAKAESHRKQSMQILSPKNVQRTFRW